MYSNKGVSCHETVPLNEEERVTTMETQIEPTNTTTVRKTAEEKDQVKLVFRVDDVATFYQTLPFSCTRINLFDFSYICTVNIARNMYL